MMYRMALPLLALAAAGGCSGRGVTTPMSRDATQVAGADLSSSAASGVRSGDLNATKECSEFHRRAGEFCTITSSNLKEIPIGTRVIYLSAAGATSLDTDVILDPPGPGNNVAYGHVFLDFATLTGRVTLTGGTGKFSHFQGSVVVTHLTGVNWAWDGSYSYSPPN
jgi:hypothetical protein